MNRITCPHCGFQNFSISAYCGRCERPLQKGTPPPARPAPPPAPAAKEPAPLPASYTPTPVSAAVSRPAAAMPPPPPRDTPRPVVRPTMAVSVPVPPPPPVAEVAPVALPIEVPRAGAATAARAASLDDEPTPPDAAPRAAVAEARPVVEIETQAASGPRLWVARGIDLLVPLAFGVGVALLESLLDGEVWEARGVWLPDYLGEWLYVHPHAVVHGAVAVAVGSLAYNLGCTRFWGRTAGRRLVCTDLVTTAGLPPGLIRITVRSIASLVSFAAFGAGHFWSVVDPERRSFHDRLAGTIVVDSRGVRSARPAL